MEYVPEKIIELKQHQVFVFGSNKSGFHGAGAAGFALRGESRNNWRQDKWFLKAMKSERKSFDRIGKWAVYGIGRGFQKGKYGNSYAIQTIERPGMKRSTSLEVIYCQLQKLVRFAKINNELEFLVVGKLGANLSGWSLSKMKEVFKKLYVINILPDNIILPKEYEYRSKKIKVRKGFKRSCLRMKKPKVIGQFNGKYSFLSNFSQHGFIYNNLYFRTNEHFYQWCKTLNRHERKKIRNSFSPGQAKKIGKTAELREDWDKIKLDVMFAGVFMKFCVGDCSAELQTKLLNTGSKKLQEGNYWGDDYWGIDLKKHKGQNHLGKILMRIRNLIFDQRGDDF